MQRKKLASLPRFGLDVQEALTLDRAKVLRASMDAANHRGDIEHAARCQKELSQLEGGF